MDKNLPETIFKVIKEIGIASMKFIIEDENKGEEIILTLANGTYFICTEKQSDHYRELRDLIFKYFTNIYLKSEDKSV